MPTPTDPAPEFLERARALHTDALVMDAHVDTVSEMLDLGYDLARAPETAHLTWDKMAIGGLKAQVFAA